MWRRTLIWWIKYTNTYQIEFQLFTHEHHFAHGNLPWPGILFAKCSDFVYKSHVSVPEEERQGLCSLESKYSFGKQDICQHIVPGNNWKNVFEEKNMFIKPCLSEHFRCKLNMWNIILDTIFNGMLQSLAKEHLQQNSKDVWDKYPFSTHLMVHPKSTWRQVCGHHM